MFTASRQPDPQPVDRHPGPDQRGIALIDVAAILGPELIPLGGRHVPVVIAPIDQLAVLATAPPSDAPAFYVDQAVPLQGADHGPDTATGQARGLRETRHCQARVIAGLQYRQHLPLIWP